MPTRLNHEGGSIAPAALAQLQRRADRLLRICGHPGAELSLLLVDDRRMEELNSHYRGKRQPTNVLAFALWDAAETPRRSGGRWPGNKIGTKTNWGHGAKLNAQRHSLPGDALLGDVVISLDTAQREADLGGVSREQRLSWLLIHGLLHLLGFDHERSPSEEAAMVEAERQLQLRLNQDERRDTMIKLAVNVDHVATLRQARGGSEPDPVLAASICELAGAAGIVVHLREDRRHIQDRDLRLLRQTVKSKLNLEMAIVPEIIDFALDLKPDMVTLVPEKRQELTTEGGLDVQGHKKKLAKVIAKMNQAGIPVSLFVDPDTNQIKTAAAIGATFIEIHTGPYCDANNEAEQYREFHLLAAAAEEALAAGLRVNAGHGLNYLNSSRVAALGTIEELSIGHAIITRAIMVGLKKAVREMLTVIRRNE
ncbi:MAG: pyridoxine 5'-phosphate synthase [Desulfobulbaceae bacterium]|nr:MAG: pyridoxine 5'-phosphate synthase [Desulfobulbaceae bacterium]